MKTLKNTLIILTLSLSPILLLASGAEGGSRSEGGNAGGGGDPARLGYRMGEVPDHLQIKRQQAINAEKQKAKFELLHKPEIDAYNQVKAWANLTVDLYTILYFIEYPFGDSVIQKLDPGQVFDSIFGEGPDFSENSKFIVRTDKLELDGNEVLFISHPDTGKIELNLNYWNRYTNVDNSLFENSNKNIKLFPSAKIIALLVHEVLVMKKLETSQEYVHSKYFGKAIENIIESTIATQWLEDNGKMSLYGSNYVDCGVSSQLKKQYIWTSALNIESQQFGPRDYRMAKGVPMVTDVSRFKLIRDVDCSMYQNRTE